jgi:hypothetical protein
MPEVEIAPGQPGSQLSPAAAPAMIIRTGHAMIEVDSLEPAIAAVRQLALQVGGYVGNTSMQTGSRERRSATLEVKLPAERWDQARGALSTIGKVETVTEDAQDVGEEFVDVSARVANARRLEERLLSLLATRTGKLEEVVAVESKLAQVREQIERYEGRLRYLRTRVAISTFNITVHESAPIVGAYRGSGVLAEAFRAAWRNFVSLVAGLIASLGWLVPLAALAFGVWRVVRRYERARRAPERGGK